MILKLGHVILAAPDLNKVSFEEYSEYYKKSSEKTTLYLSDKDVPLYLSGLIHKRNKLGYSPPITVVDGIDSIYVRQSRIGHLGHTYMADNKILLQDIRSVIESKSGNPLDRVGISKEENYYSLQAE